MFARDVFGFWVLEVANEILNMLVLGDGILNWNSGLHYAHGISLIYDIRSEQFAKSTACVSISRSFWINPPPSEEGALIKQLLSENNVP